MDCATARTRGSPRLAMADIAGLRSQMEGLQSKVDAANESMHLMEQRLVKMLSDAHDRAEHGKKQTLVEFDTVTQKRVLPMEQQLSLIEHQLQRMHSPPPAPKVSPESISRSIEIMRRVEQGVTDLLAKRVPDVEWTQKMATERNAYETEIYEQAQLKQEQRFEKLAKDVVEQLALQLSKKFDQIAGQTSSSKEESSSPPAAELPPPSPQYVSLIQTKSALIQTKSAPNVAGEDECRHASSEANPLINDHLKKLHKLSIAHESDVDASRVHLEEDGSLKGVFLNETDPEANFHRVEDHYYNTGFCQAVARSPGFASFTVFVVAANAIYLGVDSDYNHAANLYEADWGFLAISQFFCVFFTFELLVRFFAFKNKRACIHDGWFKFDTFLVVTMILDVWVLMPILYILSNDGSSIRLPTQPLRMLRLFKLTRMARLMKAFPELVTMIKGLVRSLRAIASSMVLVSLMTYTWAIFIHMLLGDEDKFNKEMKDLFQYEFSYVGDCMWVLLLAGTLMLDNTAPVMYALLYSKETARVLAGIAFMSYFFLSALLILQMLIGVLCDVVSTVGAERREAEAVGLIRQELLADLRKCDDGNGKISKPELLSVLNYDKSKALLKKLNVNRLFLIQIASLMFPNDESYVPIRKMLDVMLMCRGDNNATVEVLSSALCFLTNELSCIQENIIKCEISKTSSMEMGNTATHFLENEGDTDW